MFASLAIASAFLASAYAHGGVGSYTIGGTVYPGYQPFSPANGPPTIQRSYPSFDPLYTSSGTAIRCQTNGRAPLSATIAAGQQITATWTQWTHAEGPVTVYMAKCPGACKDWDGSGKAWFKIDEAGLLSGTVGKGRWGNTVVLETLKWTSTIPAQLAPGEYLIRHEVLALHQANTPQFYPECAQLTVTGSGTQSPSGDYLVSFPGAFSDSDPGININIYDAATAARTSYPVPGPPVWPGGTSPPPTTTIRPTTTTTTTRPTTTTTTTRPTTTTTTTTRPTTTTTNTGTSVQKYGQCGGIGYTGSTTCVSGTTCNKINDYYSQCL